MTLLLKTSVKINNFYCLIFYLIIKTLFIYNPLKGLERFKTNFIEFGVISQYLRDFIYLEEFNGSRYPDSKIYPI